MSENPGGVRLTGVRAGSPAELAGLKGNDIIAQIGETAGARPAGHDRRAPVSTSPGTWWRSASSATGPNSGSASRSAPGAADGRGARPAADRRRAAGSLLPRRGPPGRCSSSPPTGSGAPGRPIPRSTCTCCTARSCVLEAWSGRETEHTRIAVGRGVCGTAVATGEDQNVPRRPRASTNYIACNTFTRSELVVLIRRGKTILGQIDVDSDLPDPFTAEEEPRSGPSRTGSRRCCSGASGSGRGIGVDGTRRSADARAPDRPLRPWHLRACTVNGVELFERRIGAGPPVVVLHGGPGAHHDYLLPGFDALAVRRRAGLLRPARRRSFAGGRGTCRSDGGSTSPTSRRCASGGGSSS